MFGRFKGERFGKGKARGEFETEPLLPTSIVEVKERLDDRHFRVKENGHLVTIGLHEPMGDLKGKLLFTPDKIETMRAKSGKEWLIRYGTVESLTKQERVIDLTPKETREELEDLIDTVQEVKPPSPKRGDPWFSMSDEQIDEEIAQTARAREAKRNVQEREAGKVIDLSVADLFPHVEEEAPVAPPQEDVENGHEMIIREHEAVFRKERGKFTVLSQGKEHEIVNAFEEYLIPGDTVEVEILPNNEARVLRVAYASPRTVAGRVEYDERFKRYIFTPRIPAPPPSRILNKIKMPIEMVFATEAEAKEASEKGTIVLFNREKANRGALELPKQFDNESQAEQWVTLVNLGVRAYDPESLAQDERDLEATKELGKVYGVDDIEDDATIDEKIEAVLARQAEKEIKEGKVEDWRDQGVTIGIDPEGSRDHDDVFTLVRLGKDEKGVERYRIAIHISDASRFISPGGVLDERALRRATSIYTDYDTVRMLPSLISEHLGSLREGQTRFALSLIMDVTPDEKKGVRIDNVRMANTVMKVTKNATYKEAQTAINRRSQQDEVSKAIRTLFNIGKTLDERIGIRQPGDDMADEFDAVELVALFNQAKNRFAGVMLDRMTRSSSEPNLSAVQSVVQGIYRFNEPTQENKEWFIKELQKLGVLAEEDLTLPSGKARSFEAVVKRSHKRLETMDSATVDRYYELASKAMRRATTGYATKKKGHFAMGEALVAHTSSPIRRLTDLINQRIEKFALKLDALRKNTEGDVDEKKAHELLIAYAKEVFGMDLSKEADRLPFNELCELVEERTAEKMGLALASTHKRAELAKRAESATGAVSVAERIARGLEKEPILLNAPFGLSIELSPGEVERRKTKLGLRRGRTPARTETVYGQVTISRFRNRRLSGFLSERTAKRGAVLQVAFDLPPTMDDPSTKVNKWGKCEFNLAGEITNVEVIKGRLIFSMDPSKGYLDQDRPRRKGPARSPRKGR